MHYKKEMQEHNPITLEDTQILKAIEDSLIKNVKLNAQKLFAICVANEFSKGNALTINTNNTITQ